MKELDETLTAEEIEEIEALDKKKVVEKSLSIINIDPRTLIQDTQVNVETIDTGMMKQASLYAHYAVIAARTSEYADNVKTARDVLESKIDREVRDEAVSTGMKITEKMIENAIKLDSRWIRAAKATNKAKANAELAKSALEALKQKRDMLIQIGVSIREEMKGEMRLKEMTNSSSSVTAGSISRQRAMEIAKG